MSDEKERTDALQAKVEALEKALKRLEFPAGFKTDAGYCRACLGFGMTPIPNRPGEFYASITPRVHTADCWYVAALATTPATVEPTLCAHEWTACSSGGANCAKCSAWELGAAPTSTLCIFPCSACGRDACVCSTPRERALTEALRKALPHLERSASLDLHRQIDAALGPNPPSYYNREEVARMFGILTDSIGRKHGRYIWKNPTQIFLEFDEETKPLTKKT